MPLCYQATNTGIKQSSGIQPFMFPSRLELNMPTFLSEEVNLADCCG